jgi:leader peptidase (prepilin peptidase)/N-methyltransferase
MTTVLIAGSAVLGLAIGSFLNVVIHRVPLHQSVVRPGSRCPSCTTTLRGRDNVPVASWVLLGRRCRHCAAPISARYPLVEVGTAVLFAALAVRLGVSWALPAYAVCFASLLALSVIDLDHGVLPARIIYPTLVLSGVLLVVAALAEDRWGDLRHALLGGIAVWVFFGALWLVYPRGMGFGDVRLSPLLGAHLGFLSLMHVFVGIFLAALLGAVSGLALQATGRRGGRDPIPFGPFLALGTLVTVLFGASFLGWYDQSVLGR